MRNQSSKQCSEEGCPKGVWARGLCIKHYDFHKYRGTLPERQHFTNDGRSCSVKECERKSHSRGMCIKHYGRWFRNGATTLFNRTPCSVEGCNEMQYAKRYCSGHYSMNKRFGDPITDQEFSEGEGWLHHSGYRMIHRPLHQNANGAGYIAVHRFVYSRYLGRLLRDDERVHHLDGRRDNNDIDNLELWTTAHPSGQRPADLVAFAKEILERYEGELKLF